MQTKLNNLLKSMEVKKNLEAWSKWFGASEWRKNLAVFIITSAGVLVGLLLSSGLRAGSSPVTEPVIEHVPPINVADMARQVVMKNLDWADAQSAAGLQPHLIGVQEFFDAARERTRTYSEIVLGWDSKWKLASDYVTGDHQHEDFLHEQFAATLFSDEELEQLVEQSVASYLRYTQDVEAQMLVRMKADLEQLPLLSIPAFVDRDTLHAILNGALNQAMIAAQGELGAAVGREVVSYVAGELLTMVAAQLATSAGILGAGAGSGWATFGIGVGVSLLVDVIVTDIYQKQFDPAGKLTEALNQQLDQMQSLIIKGTSEIPGLEYRLHDYAKRRNIARRQVIHEAVLSL